MVFAQQTIHHCILTNNQFCLNHLGIPAGFDTLMYPGDPAHGKRSD